MKNIYETVRYYEDLMRFLEIKDSDNLDEILELSKSMSNYIQNNKINKNLLKHLQSYGDSLENEQELVICIKDLIYSVGNDNQTKIDIGINEGDCFKVTDYGWDTITLESFNAGITIRMKESTFKYYFGVINSKGKSLKDFFQF